MKRPLYQVGEKVMLNCATLTEYNGGPFEVDTVKYETREVRGEGRKVEDYYYTLVGVDVELKGYSSFAWRGGHLRKYYPPATVGFKELMTTLVTSKVV